MIGIGTQVIAEPVVATGAPNTRILGLEPISQASPVSLCSPFWKNSQQLQAQQHTQNGFLVGADAQNSGLQELYQRLKSSTSYPTDNSPLVLSNVAASSSSSSTSTILDSSPVVGGELGYWNPAFSWSDLPN
uniref:Uncharacterized protein n=1 Tax=Rhizophora mucronata TaxID=61149 RepID=A0A2P2QLZ8_RHIMU